MQLISLQEGRMLDKVQVMNLVLRVALDEVPAPRGPLLRGICYQMVRAMLLPCSPEATLQ